MHEVCEQLQYQKIDQLILRQSLIIVRSAHLACIFSEYRRSAGSGVVSL
jgi:hypothetical protein